MSQSPTTQSKNSRRAAWGSFVGTTIEWYDFFLYGLASALVIGPLFFPEVSPAVGLLASFATFGVGYLARPLGGLIFGHFGDKFSRKAALITTLIMMGVATFIIGILPTYAAIGMWAPAILVFLRLIQGIAVGGEWGGAVLMASESAPKGRGVTFGAFAQAGSPAGALLANGVFLLFRLLPDEQFMSWGWRIPFLLAGAMALVGLFIRLKVVEPAVFVAAKAEAAEKTDTKAQVPLFQLLRTSWPLVLLGIGACAWSVGSSTMNTFVLSWTTSEIGVAASTMLNVTLIQSAVALLWTPFAALIAEKIGVTRFMVLCLSGNFVWVVPYFLLNATGTFGLILIAYIVSAIFSQGLYAVIAGFLARTFPTKVRYTAISVSYQGAASLIAGTLPFVAQALLAGFGSISVVAVMILAIVATTITCIAVLSRLHAKRVNIDEEDDVFVSSVGS